MDRGTKVFWIIIGLLLAASVGFGTRAEDRRRAAQTRGGSLASGDVVELLRVTDGDTVVVKTSDGQEAVVRLLGIKAFDPAPGKDPVAELGRSAVRAIESTAAGRPLRVLLHATPQDRHGRTIATLIVGEEDLALRLVSRGHALVYPVYPFATLPLYLDAQNRARGQRVGLWANDAATRRAEALIAEWAKRGEE